jgi:hypothetical protein
LRVVVFYLRRLLSEMLAVSLFAHLGRKNNLPRQVLIVGVPLVDEILALVVGHYFPIAL